MSLTRLILRFAAPLPKIESFERYLFIGPHPDDIEIGAGATTAKLAALGKAVTFLVCTDGRFGEGNVPETGDALAALRQQEAIASAKLLGVTDVRFLGLSDGGFYAQDDLIAGIAKVIGEVQPDVLFAPDPCVHAEGHADHLRVGEAVRSLALFAPHRGIMAGLGTESARVRAVAFFMTARVNRYVCTRGYLKKQLDAIFTCHKSQFPEGSADGKSIALYLRIRAADFGIRSLTGCAEGFRVLDQLHMHCLPEAD